MNSTLNNVYIEIRASDSNDTNNVFSHKVILFNCNCHTFDEVISQLIKATQCLVSRAHEIAKTAHMTGRAIAYSGNKEKCETVSKILEEIGLKTTIEE